MAEPLKAVFNPPFVRDLGELIRSVYGPFDTDRFTAHVMDGTWEQLELKARIRRITEALGAALPGVYADALDVLYAVDGQCKGLPYLIFPDFVEVYGQAPEHWDLSMRALERFTAGSSSEFAVRPFLLREPQRMIRQMEQWAEHGNEHIRRLASEGCRPRLPWAQALPMFKADPAPILIVLEKLKKDPSLYVRKSVANNLNDIAKDHPGLVLETARRWQGESPYTDWIIRHGCRTLIRRADAEALAIFGYADGEGGEPLVVSASLELTPDAGVIGDKGLLRYTLRLREGDAVRIRIEYGIDFVKASGKTSRKLFLLSDKTVPGGSELTAKRSHSWSDLSTRKHYPGLHRISLLVNGREAAAADFTLNAGPVSEASDRAEQSGTERDGNQAVRGGDGRPEVGRS
jgi:3-methyladenine DNA glycosylase AlkC